MSRAAIGKNAPVVSLLTDRCIFFDGYLANAKYERNVVERMLHGEKPGKRMPATRRSGAKLSWHGEEP